ncbi:MAG: flagellar basal body rod protein FlgB [Chloroflexi bacterium]|nr:flagellar basal body rod protein FlgB [Chloroflexota bacterium]MBV9131826.1 flagellar basal body rod protein FlgB [Chloroflexota bacterium]
MSDLNSINFSGTDSYLQAAMSGLAARQKTIANNVANVDTPGFKASQVNFEDVLNKAVSTAKPGGPVNQSALDAAARTTSLVDSTSSRSDGNNVDIDQQMEMLSEANLNYSALTQVMSTRLGILRSVIKGQ